MTTPFPFQRKAVRKVDRLAGRAILGHPFGLGKSFISLLWASENPDARPVIIVCPASLKWNWERQAIEHLGLRCDVLEGMKPKKIGKQRLNKPAPITIINYDILFPWLEYLKGMKPQLIILDESHYLKNPETKRVKNVRVLCDGVTNVLALTATSILQSPIDLYPTLNLLRPDLWNSRMAFAMRYCKPRKTIWGWQFKGARNLDELHRILKREVLCRCTKESVMDQLPQMARNIVMMELSDHKEYRKAENDFIRWLREKSPAKARRARAVEFLVKSGYLKRLAAELKLKSVIEWLENFQEQTNEKIIVFGHHKNIVNGLHKHFRKQSVVVTGETIGRKRQDAIDCFLRKKSCQILFGNLQAAGVGWSALGVSHVGFVELAWNPSDHTQAEGRAHGIGRGKEGVQSTSWWLIGKGTIEEKLCRLLQDRQGIVDQTLDGKAGVASLDIADRLERELLNL